MHVTSRICKSRYLPSLKIFVDLWYIRPATSIPDGASITSSPLPAFKNKSMV